MRQVFCSLYLNMRAGVAIRGQSQFVYNNRAGKSPGNAAAGPGTHPQTFEAVTAAFIRRDVKDPGQIAGVADLLKQAE